MFFLKLQVAIRVYLLHSEMDSNNGETQDKMSINRKTSKDIVQKKAKGIESLPQEIMLCILSAACQVRKQRLVHVFPRSFQEPLLMRTTHSSSFKSDHPIKKQAFLLELIKVRSLSVPHFEFRCLNSRWYAHAMVCFAYLIRSTLGLYLYNPLAMEYTELPFQLF